MHNTKPSVEITLPTEKELISNKIKFGKPSELTDAELLSILIDRNGTKNQILSAQDIIDVFSGDLSEISNLDFNTTMRRTRLSAKQTIQLLALVELSSRIKQSEKKEVIIIKNSADIMTLLQPLLGAKIQEEFWVVYLNNSNRVLEKTMICQGSIESTSVDIKLIVRRALNLLSTKIILAHNHPCGTLTPSPADIDTTAKITNAAALFDIKVIDHLIISQSEYYSFNDNL